MITPSPEDYGYLQVQRPVIEGCDAFLARASRIGHQILGDEVVAAMTELGLPEVGEDEALPEPVHVVSTLTNSVMFVGERKDLNAVLLHRAVRGNLASRYSFGYHQGLFAADNRIVRGRLDVEGVERGKHQVPSLKEELDAVSVRHDKDPDRLPVVCDRVGVLGEPGDKLILALFPRAKDIGTRILHEQAKVCFTRLERQSSRTAFPISPWSVGVPFARIPGTIKDAQYERLLDRLQELTPERIVLGGIEYSSKDRPRTEPQRP
jgi:hypothetical protein